MSSFLGIRNAFHANYSRPLPKQAKKDLTVAKVDFKISQIAKYALRGVVILAFISLLVVGGAVLYQHCNAFQSAMPFLKGRAMTWITNNARDLAIGSGAVLLASSVGIVLLKRYSHEAKKEVEKLTEKNVEAQVANIRAYRFSTGPLSTSLPRPTCNQVNGLLLAKKKANAADPFRSRSGSAPTLGSGHTPPSTLSSRSHSGSAPASSKVLFPQPTQEVGSAPAPLSEESSLLGLSIRPLDSAGVPYGFDSDDDDDSVSSSPSPSPRSPSGSVFSAPKEEELNSNQR